MAHVAPFDFFHSLFLYAFKNGSQHDPLVETEFLEIPSSGEFCMAEMTSLTSLIPAVFFSG